MRKADRAAGDEADSKALSVLVAGERLAIPAEQIFEVIRDPALTRVPLSPPGLLGVANLRGTVIPIVSLAALIGRPADDHCHRVVVVGRTAPVGLAVDEVTSLGRSLALKSGGEPPRFIDVDELLAKQFGSLSKPASGARPSSAMEATEDSSSVAAGRAFLSFSVAGQEFGLPLGCVQEVLGTSAPITGVPETDDAMLGAFTVRDRLLPLVSLRALLGLGHGEDTLSKRVVVASIGAIPVGLVVDSLNAIERASDEQIDPVPMVLTRGRQEARIQAICRLDQGQRLMSILSTEHLFEKDLADRLAAQGQDEVLTMTEDTSVGESEQFVIFQLGAEHYGLPIGSVSEVVAPPAKLTKLPKAPKFVDGVMNLRGEVVPVIDQRRRFNVSAEKAGQKTRIIVVRIGTGLAGFVVDAVSEVLKIDSAQLRASPALTSAESKVIDRIASLDRGGRMILLVDPQELLDRAEQDLVAAMRGTATAKS